MTGARPKNLVLGFEGTGQGVAGRRTNVSLVCELAGGFGGQAVHLENGPGAKFGSWLAGGVAGVGWRVIFARARRWFEANYSALPSDGTETKVFLFGFSRGALLARHFAAWLDKLGVKVAFLGVWDTVDATPGLQVGEKCPGNVGKARHAVAEDERRRFFRHVPLLGVREGQVEEELFPGVHSDVGGLYEDNHVLADLARGWVLAGAKAAGMEFAEDVTGRPSARRARHDSLRLGSNLWGLLKARKRVFAAGMARHRYRAVVALGSNLGSRREYLERALARLGELRDTVLVKASRVIETEGVDVPAEFADRKFLNQVAVFATRMDPYEFSRRMHGIEDELGRVRGVRNGPRTIDLDLIDFDGLRLEDPELTLPHPRAAERDFVQVPLRELVGTRAD